MVDEVIFPADHEFPAGRFDHPELRQLAKALPAVLLLDRAAITVATYLRAYNACIVLYAALLPADPVVFTLCINRPGQCLR